MLFSWIKNIYWWHQRCVKFVNGSQLSHNCLFCKETLLACNELRVNGPLEQIKVKLSLIWVHHILQSFFPMACSTTTTTSYIIIYYNKNKGNVFSFVSLRSPCRWMEDQVGKTKTHPNHFWKKRKKFHDLIIILIFPPNWGVLVPEVEINSTTSTIPVALSHHT